MKVRQIMYLDGRLKKLIDMSSETIVIIMYKIMTRKSLATDGANR